MQQDRKNFITFLKSKNCFNDYLTNVLFDKKERFPTFLQSRNSTRSIIDASFTWRETKNGHFYWSSLNQEWNRALDSRATDDFVQQIKAHLSNSTI